VTTRMATEIGQQPATLAATLDALLPRLAELRSLAAGRPHILLVARGTSDNAGVYGRYLLEIHAGRGASLAAPSLATHYTVRRSLSDSLVVCLSQSGETEEIVETQGWAAGLGARTVAITNVARSSLAAGADVALVLEAGLEEAVPATKSYTAQLAAVAVLAAALGPDDSTLITELKRTPAEVSRLLDRRLGVDAAVERLLGGESTLVSGRGLVYGTALEVALKLEESCLRPVRGLSYADLRHGPIAVVESGVAAILLAAADGPMVPGMTELAADLSGLGASVIAVGGNRAFRDAASVVVEGPDLPEIVAPLGLIVPPQLIVEQLARELGLDADAPRGLTKTTQTDRG
jgi:glutamine---fructose-6-phosphate transaminase (isomerizing)